MRSRRLVETWWFHFIHRLVSIRRGRAVLHEEAVGPFPVKTMVHAGVASPETREVHSAPGEVPCFINLDDEKQQVPPT